MQIERTGQTNRTKTKIIDLYIDTICLFPIATLLLKVGGDGIITKGLFGIMVLMHCFVLLKQPVKKNTMFFLMITFINYIFALFATEFPLQTKNLLFYYPYFILYTFFCIDYKQDVCCWIQNNRGFVLCIIRVWNALVGISMFLPGCYYIKESGRKYFGSFTGTIFRLGPSAVFIQALVLISMVFYKRKKDIIYMIIPMCCFFMGSSRTYLIVGGCLFAIAWYWICQSKRKIYLTIIPLFIVAIILTTQSALGDKIAYTLDPNRYGGFWYKVTSARSLVWAIDINAWSLQPIWKKMMGSGLEFTQKVSGILGHNDFVELLCSFGVLGVLVYTISMLKMIRRFIIKRRVPMTIIICAVTCWLFNACFNMHYTYFCCLLCYPFVLIAINNYYPAETEN